MPVSSRRHSTAWVGLPSAASLACTRFTSVSASPPSTVRPAGLLATMMSSSSYTNTAAGGGRLSNLVVTQKQADGIAVLHRGGKRLLLPFSFDLSSSPAGPCSAGPGPGGVLVHQILVQPHRQQAFYMQFFHWVVNS